MKKWLFFIPVFLFACKKKSDQIPLTKANQNPKIISFFNVNVNTNLENLRFQINYYYNDSSRIDSISISDNTFKFDYSELAVNSKIILKDNSDLTSGIIFYDNIFYNLTSYRHIFGIGDTSENWFQFDSISRLKKYEYSNNNNINNFVITQTYKKDTVFVHTVFPNFTCISNDTIKNSSVDMNKTLPYLLFTKIYNSCSATLVNSDVLSALSLSSFTNKLPMKIIHNNLQTDYIYTYDDFDRVILTEISTKNRNVNTVISKNRIKIVY